MCTVVQTGGHYDKTIKRFSFGYLSNNDTSCAVVRLETF